MGEEMGNGGVSFEVAVVVRDVFADEIGEVEFVVLDEGHDGGCGAEDFGDGGDVVAGGGDDGLLVEVVGVGEGAVGFGVEGVGEVADGQDAAREGAGVDGLLDDGVDA